MAYRLVITGAARKDLDQLPKVGKYRVIYEIDKSASTVTVAKVEHRKSVYRKR